MGATTPFRKPHVPTTVPIEADKIYLLERDERVPLEMLPFFRFMTGPRTEENACYFYNRVDKDGIRWVYYHFEPEAELTQPDQAVPEILPELER